MKDFKVLELSLEELQALHVATDHKFFKCGEIDENGFDNVVPTTTERNGKFLLRVDKLTAYAERTGLEIDISGLTQITFIPSTEEI